MQIVCGSRYGDSLQGGGGPQFFPKQKSSIEQEKRRQNSNGVVPLITIRRTISPYLSYASQAGPSTTLLTRDGYKTWTRFVGYSSSVYSLCLDTYLFNGTWMGCPIKSCSNCCNKQWTESADPLPPLRLLLFLLGLP